jgi:DNA invertase Pin-like site-specific DNA recombinase
MKIGYARVSTDAQEPHLQMDALKRAKCNRIYEEKASGAKAERLELMRLLDNARKGDVIIVWKLDRLARSLRQLIDTTVLLNERSVELHSLTENINTTTPSGKLTFHIFAALADYAERGVMQATAPECHCGLHVGAPQLRIITARKGKRLARPAP